MTKPKSWKKLAAAVVAAVIVAAGQQLGIEQEKVALLVKIAIGYIVGQGMADFGKNAGN